MAALGANASDVSRQLRRIQAEYPGRRGARRRPRADRAHDGHAALRARPRGAADRAAATGAACGSTRSPTCATRRPSSARSRCLNGKPVVGFQIVRAWGASALDVAKQARAKVDASPSEYPNINFDEASSTVGYIQTSFDSSMEMLIEGAILAVLVVWLFLRDWRATVISAVALPLSIIPTFWADLFARLLAEHPDPARADARGRHPRRRRHRRGREHRAPPAQGKTPKQAAMDAAIEIGLAVVATSLTICAVFIPVAFMSGIAGQFFAPVRLHGHGRRAVLAAGRAHADADDGRVLPEAARAARDAAARSSAGTSNACAGA